MNENEVTKKVILAMSKQHSPQNPEQPLNLPELRRELTLPGKAGLMVNALAWDPGQVTCFSPYTLEPGAQGARYPLPKCDVRVYSRHQLMSPLVLYLVAHCSTSIQGHFLLSYQ